MPRERVTACLIVQDEQEHLPRALDSVAFCDEIVVVDGGSSDHTVSLAQAAGAHVIENPWPGFAAQRNVALDAATSEWTLEIDADERVSPQLRASIEALLKSAPPETNIAVCPLRNRFLGAPLGPSAKYPAYRSRLFRRSAYRHDELRSVHEGIEPHEQPVLLEGDLEHDLARTLREALVDALRYARLESARIDPPRDARSYIVGILLRPPAKLAYRTAIDGGWRDGWRGLLKIALDAGSDALVWMLVLFRCRPEMDLDTTHFGTGIPPHTTPSNIDAPPATGGPLDSDVSISGFGKPKNRHFGRRPAGRPKIVAIARRGHATATALRWLENLQAAGIDVALVTDDHDHSSDLSIRRVRRLWPLATTRALDIEMQVRTAHAVVPFGRWAKLLWRLLPGSLRPAMPGLDAEADPAATAKRA